MASTTDLPLDIIQTILQNLHVKSLLRFKAVCKSWNDIITDPRFIKVHRETLKNSSPQNFFLCKRDTSLNDELSVLKFANAKPEFSELRQHPKGRVLCTGDGLVLLGNITTCTEGDLYGLWNPASGKRAFFWCPYRWDHRWTEYGFSRDPNSGDYKVVIKHKAKYAVFSCKNKTWTKKQKFQFHTTMSQSSRLYADGFAFWLSEENYQQTKDILYFDPRNDKFKKLQMPNGTGRFVRMTSVGGCLCLYDNTEVRGSFVLRMWIMEGPIDTYSWSEFMKFQTVRSIDDAIYGVPMSCTPIETLAHFKHGIRQNFPVIPYVESLFFPISDSTRPKRKRSPRDILDVADDCGDNEK